MTDEDRFYRRFVEDVRRCAGADSRARVAEIEHRVRVALIAPPSARERRWARVVDAIDELLGGTPDRDADAAARLRAFAHENADLRRPRDVAITDFRMGVLPQGVLIGPHERVYLLLAPAASLALPPIGALDEVVPGASRRLAAWAVYGLCGGAALAAFWFSFIVPV